jgi:collagen triple helix repeat protein
MNADNFAALADSMLESMRAYCDDRIAKASDRPCALCGQVREQYEALHVLYLEIEQRMATIPAGPQGERGEQGEKGERGEPGAQGEPGRDGLNGQGERGERGEKGETGDKGERGLPGRDGRDGLDGKDGAPGNDALHLDVLEAIDATRCYRRGTIAKHAGGLVRAFRNTDVLGEGGLEKSGWHVIVNGVADASSERLALTDGRTLELKLKPNWVGKFDPHGEYTRGDMVTYRGSVWHCNVQTSEPPGNGAVSWTLAVKGML